MPPSEARGSKRAGRRIDARGGSRSANTWRRRRKRREVWIGGRGKGGGSIGCCEEVAGEERGGKRELPGEGGAIPPIFEEETVSKPCQLGKQVERAVEIHIEEDEPDEGGWNC